MMSVILAMLILGGIGACAGGLLALAATRFAVPTPPIIDRLDALLPQTQCGQCGYPGCRPYAEALAKGDAINKCVPGGEATMLNVAKLLEVAPQPMGEDMSIPIKLIAVIDEQNCIGCTKCIQVCPVDAIIGASKMMHTVVIPDCTGCTLCVAPCPTDCIKMVPLPDSAATWRPSFPRTLS